MAAKDWIFPLFMLVRIMYIMLNEELDWISNVLHPRLAS